MPENVGTGVPLAVKYNPFLSRLDFKYTRNCLTTRQFCNLLNISRGLSIHIYGKQCSNDYPKEEVSLFLKEIKTVMD